MRRGALALGLGIVLASVVVQAGPYPGGEPDSDGDTVNNSFDNCSLVASPSQVDSDHNGCGDACQEPITCDLAGDMNYAVGAGDQAIIGMNFGMAGPPGTLGDCDGNGVVGASDLAVFGMEFLNMVGSSGISNADTDGDTVENAFDNCTLIGNPSQVDSDHNGCGDACQPPITCDEAGDMNLVVCAGDQAVIGMYFGMAVPPGMNGDCDGNGVVGASDLAVYGQESLNMVGPSGITSAACDPTTCLCTPQ